MRTKNKWIWVANIAFGLLATKSAEVLPNTFNNILPVSFAMPSTGTPRTAAIYPSHVFWRSNTLHGLHTCIIHSVTRLMGTTRKKN